ncbi:MAG: Bug family tripartite tricarboxylate transporter substrate binding protein [Xanthobacteraceae bacterium]
MNRRSRRVSQAFSTVTAVLIAINFAEVANAQSYPSRPIRLIVPFAAGGPTDLVGRSLGEKLTASLGQPIVVENRTGAGGNIGTEAAAKSAPDGYTLLLVLSGTLVANPAVFKKLPFDPARDFEPISLMTSNSQMLVTHPSVPVKTVAEFVAYAKKKPITYAHAGPGSGGHLAMGYFRLLAGFAGTPVPYRGNAPLMVDLSAGQVQSGFIASAGAIPHVRAGRLTGLAISSAKRSPLAPNVPTVAEAGYPQIKLNTYFVLLAPAKTPPSIIAVLEREVRKAIKRPDLQKKWRASDIEPLGTSAAEAKATLAVETKLWADIVKRAKLQQ